mgnify:CR=1 FL=1
MDKETAKKKVKSFLLGLSAIIVLIIIVPRLFSAKEQSVPVSERGCEQYNTNAVVMGREFLEDHLQYAASSHIPSGFESAGVVTCNGSVFTLTDWVQAANAFGAKQKVYYTIQLEFLGGTWTRKSSWKELSFTFKE